MTADDSRIAEPARGGEGVPRRERHYTDDRDIHIESRGSRERAITEMSAHSSRCPTMLDDQEDDTAISNSN